jgi:VIT1/CCC1 family predicted Fe2+/Mn2+ transporter
MGAVGGLLFALPNYIKTKQWIVLIISPISMGLFFGTLVSVSSVLSKLEEPSAERDSEMLRAAFKDTKGSIRYSANPFWLHTITNNN